MSDKQRPGHLYWGSLLAALVLQLVELPYGLALFRPLFVPMVLAYWALILPPQPTGLFMAWVLGLALDVLLGSVMGQHALGMVLIVFMVRNARNFLSLFPVWQVGLVLTPLWLAYVFLMFWIDGVTIHRADPWLRWLPILSTGVLWGPVTAVLSGLRRQEMEDPSRL